MAYFAFDKPLPETAGDIVEQIAALQHTLQGTPATVCALIDCAFDESFFARTFRTPAPCISLYERTNLRALGHAAPFLVQAPDAANGLSEWTERLLTAVDARPMWSLIVATVGIHELAGHFSPFLIARCDDKLEWPVRWGDARVLPSLLNMLSPALTQDLLRPMYRWFVPSRHGELLSWSGPGVRPGNAPAYRNMHIDDATFARIVDAAEADAVLAQIDDSEPELLRYRQPTDCYRLISRQLEIADASGIDQPAARKHFCAMALYLKEGFVLTPHMQSFLANVKAGANYYAEIDALPAEFWQMAGP